MGSKGEIHRWSSRRVLGTAHLFEASLHYLVGSRRLNLPQVRCGEIKGGDDGLLKSYSYGNLSATAFAREKTSSDCSRLLLASCAINASASA